MDSVFPSAEGSAAAATAGDEPQGIGEQPAYTQLVRGFF
jgi:hypothetical protein